MDDAPRFVPDLDTSKPARSPRNAATVLVVRDGPAGMEVLLVKRPERAGDLFSGACVFPGGVVDSGDRQLYDLCAGLDDAAASAMLRVERHGLEFFVAAIRECFEEAGLLFAYDAQGAPIDIEGERLESLRRRLEAGETSFGEICRQLDLRLAADGLVYDSHWLTPPGLPKRFDTRFFLAVAPSAQTALHDGREAEQHFWLRPEEAVARSVELQLRDVTHAMLETLLPFSSAAACMAHARRPREIERTMGRVASGSQGRRSLLGDDPAYAEVGRIDPDGRGDASYELLSGRAVRLSERVIRVTAPNGSIMTGPGTNCYLVAAPGGKAWAAIDPGPDMPGHVDAILAAAPGPISWILVTHTHIDHSPAAAALKSRTGARLYGQRPPKDGWQDSGFAPDQLLSHGDRVSLGDGATLRVVHTPGHASNHLCYLLEEEQTLFTGDHVMQGSTVVINPPDGDMIAYLASLRLLLGEDIAWLAPGHGHLMDRPHTVVERTIAHRLGREAKVVAVLRAMAPATLEGLLPRVYDDVAAVRHGVALRSLLAHLNKLQADGLARERDGQWQLA